MSDEQMIMRQGGGVAPMVIPYMPGGVSVICATVNGKPGRRRVVVDEAACARLNADLACKLAAAAARQQARPVVLFDHRQGEAAAFPRRFVWAGPERGIMLELEAWSEAGRRAVEGRNYGYISPSFRVSRSDGQVLGLTDGVEVCSLVNDPAFERIDPIMDSVAAARAYELPEGEGVDVIGAEHCNEQHIPGCPNGSGGSKWVADPKWSFGEAVQNAFAAENKPKKAYIFRVGKYPEVMQKIVPWEGDVVIRWDNLEKVNSKHGLTPDQIATLPQELEKPIAVMEDPEKDNEYLIVTALEAPDRKGNVKKAAAILKLRRDEAGNIEVADISSAYARDDSSKYVAAIEGGKLRYLDKERAMEWAKLERDRVSRLLTTNQATHSSEVIIKGGRSDVKEENAPEGIFAMLLSKSEKKAGEHLSSKPLRVHRTDAPPAKTTLLDVLRDVKSDFQGKPRFLERKDDDIQSGGVNGEDECGREISPRVGVAKGEEVEENIGAAKKEPGGARNKMNAEIKKKLGLPDDADDAAVDAAVTELIGERDKHKKRVAEVEAECKKKDEALKAARAAEKEAWLDELQRSGRIAPKDEEAIEAASALFELDAVNARKAYEKMAVAVSVAEGEIISAGKPTAGAGDGKSLAERLQEDFNI